MIYFLLFLINGIAGVFSVYSGMGFAAALNLIAATIWLVLALSDSNKQG